MQVRKSKYCWWVIRKQLKSVWQGHSMTRNDFRWFMHLKWSRIMKHRRLPSRRRKILLLLSHRDLSGKEKQMHLFLREVQAQYLWEVRCWSDVSEGLRDRHWHRWSRQQKVFLCWLTVVPMWMRSLPIWCNLQKWVLSIWRILWAGRIRASLLSISVLKRKKAMPLSNRRIRF